MSALIVIPARLGSTRLPRKPMRDLGGEPLVVRVAQRVHALSLDARMVVATDDDGVAAAVRRAGFDAVLTRPDHPSGTDRVAEVAQLPAYAGHDVIINVQGDEPFVSVEAISAARSQVESGAHQIGTVACRDEPAILAMPSVVKVVRDAQGRALYFSRAGIPFLRDPDAGRQHDALVLRHVGVYSYRRAGLLRWISLPPAPLELVEQLEQLRPLHAGLSIGVGLIAAPPAGGIDTEEDLARANAAWPDPPGSVTSPVHAGTR